MYVLIPSYLPTTRLLELVSGLQRSASAPQIVIVDDGSGPAYSEVFRRATDAGAIVVRYADNRGKGFALKRGFAEIQARGGGDVVTADADGQHSVIDIERVGRRLAVRTDTVVLGSRRFTAPVPRRSRVGNTLARMLFRGATGLSVRDTQTGLRGFPAASVSWAMSVGGDRFDYETRMLVALGPAGWRIDEIDISTIYLDNNRSSHFRPVVDSVRVMRPFLGFMASSFVSFLVDVMLVTVLYSVTNSLIIAVLGARVASATLNFVLNRSVVFRRSSAPAGSSSSSPRAAVPGRLARSELMRYVALAAALVALSYFSLGVLLAFGASVLVAKCVSDGCLYLVSFWAQRAFVFRAARAQAPPSTAQQPDQLPPKPVSATGPHTINPPGSARPTDLVYKKELLP